MYNFQNWQNSLSSWLYLYWYEYIGSQIQYGNLSYIILVPIDPWSIVEYKEALIVSIIGKKFVFSIIIIIIESDRSPN